MARDIGSMFERMTRRAPGGRRLDNGDVDREHDGESAEPATATTGGGGLADVLKDVLGRGRDTARRTTDRVRERATRTSRTSGSAATRRRDLPPEGTVVVEYSPDMDDGDPDPGEVVWAWVPFEEDPDQGKDRPVVVIGRRGRKLVGVPLTTKRNGREAQIAIGTGGWDPKRRQSYARIWRMLDLDPTKMRREGAVLTRTKFDQIVAAVDEYYEVRRKQPSATDDDFDYDY